MKIKFGAIYRRKDIKYNNSQAYGYWVPMKLNGKYKMVDTYQIETTWDYPMRKMEGKIKFLEDMEEGPSAKINWQRPCYYYENEIFLSSDNLDDSIWEEVCDLHECALVASSDIPNYRSEDLFENIPLYREENYSWDGDVGCTYKKKTTQINPDMVVFRYGHKVNEFVWNNENAVNWEKTILEKALNNPLVTEETKNWGQAIIEKYKIKKKMFKTLKEEYQKIDGKYGLIKK